MNKELIKNLELFKNNVLCRTDSNQHKAYKIFEKIKIFLTKEEIYYINDDWVHYITDVCRTTDQFGETIQKIIDKYKNV